jgi:phenylacetate-CoA ligase
MVMYMAEAMPHGGREHIEGRFGIPVMSRYSAAEALKIGYFCEERTGFHLHEDLCHVRIVGADGRALGTGEQGQIVISNLVNRGSVLLNYPIGDLGAISAAGCRCGRTFRLLSELEGRVEDILRLADGGFVHPRAIWQVFKDDREVLQYQLTQHEPRRFTVELATIDEAAFGRAVGRVMPELEGLLGPDPTIAVSRRSELARQGDGKFRAVASMCSR